MKVWKCENHLLDRILGVSVNNYYGYLRSFSAAVKVITTTMLSLNRQYSTEMAWCPRIWHCAQKQNYNGRVNDPVLFLEPDYLQAEQLCQHSPHDLNLDVDQQIEIQTIEHCTHANTLQDLLKSICLQKRRGVNSLSANTLGKLFTQRNASIAHIR